jgi:tetratricopeptide (TPR) repeat protein
VLLLAAGCATIDIEVHGRRGDTYINRGQYDLAIAEFNRVLEIDPKDARGYLGRGNAYKGKKQFDQAISDYNKALEINPRFAEAMKFANRVAELAEQEGHHPDIHIHYKLVRADTGPTPSTAFRRTISSSPPRSTHRDERKLPAWW